MSEEDRLYALYLSAVQRIERRVLAHSSEPLRREATALARRLWDARSLQWRRPPKEQDDKP